MHYCPNCGSKTDPHGKFCENCGYKLQKASAKPRYAILAAVVVLFFLLATSAFSKGPGHGIRNLFDFHFIRTALKSPKVAQPKPTPPVTHTPKNNPPKVTQPETHTTNIPKTGKSKLHKGIYIFRENDRYGLVNESLIEILPANNEEIIQQGKYTIVNNGNRSTVYNHSGEIIANPGMKIDRMINKDHFTSLSSDGEQSLIYHISGELIQTVDGKAQFSKDKPKILHFHSEAQQKVTILNKDFSIRYEGPAEDVSEGNHVKSLKQDVFSFQRDGKWGMMNQFGEVLISPNYDYLSAVSDDGLIGFSQENQGGVMDINQQPLFTEAVQPDGQILHYVTPKNNNFIYRENTDQKNNYRLWNRTGLQTNEIDDVGVGFYMQDGDICNFDGIKLGEDPTDIICFSENGKDFYYQGVNGALNIVDGKTGEVLASSI